jgi:hypothetical protein
MVFCQLICWDDHYEAVNWVIPGPVPLPQVTNALSIAE